MRMLRLTVMLTPENIVASFASIHSASKLLIFATSRLKTTLSCFARSSANRALGGIFNLRMLRLTVMLTPENIVASFASIHSASKLLIFATSRLKTTLSCFARSSANRALGGIFKGIHCVSLCVSAMTYFPGSSPTKYFRHCKA